jgi:toxin ParE1/3/4
MARIELAPEIQYDFDRILDHLAGYAVEDAPGRIREIIQAIDVLEHNPLIGRPVSADARELVIGRRARGYVALYRYIEQIDTLLVLAIRSQREAGYGRT